MSIMTCSEMGQQTAQAKKVYNIDITPDSSTYF